MLDIIQYGDIKKYKRYIPLDINSNSKLYFDKDLIHKIPHIKERELNQVLKYIDELGLKELVEIKKLIYRNNIIIGYSMKNYKEYKSLGKFKHRDFNLKKNDCLKIVEIFNVLIQKNLRYIDCHKGNILLNEKNNDIKLCDIDSLIFTENETFNNADIKRLMKLLLSYLYNINTEDISNVLRSEGIDLIDSFINNYCYERIDMNIEIIYDIINKMKYDHIKKEKKYIITKSKELSKMGYSNYFR